MTDAMTDRELLEMAAKAAGIVWSSYHLTKGLCLAPTPYAMNITAFWNPLTEDGDALRLAVKLKLDVEFGNRYYFNEGPMTSCGTRWDSNESTEFRRFVMHKGEPEAATRRAIVRAAAVLGMRE